ncbi:hypothetical protein BH708_00335 [Brachybacterium sp. P6-10-X1]|uniref:hypothetical protein n=1 Tax=Brachybacterium sp. P6-10-X1 TaxID=1903186 RepID=UPI000971B4DB|nr:hypothetical protein [Brachybacterium sp. P6-10-X1]APX31429.1 hypothetical protein BH708_00335 [Brachybacterium sp. P6-10-X1]
MTTRGSILTHPTGSTVQDERERIRAHLLDLRPELAALIEVGPSGALLLPLSAGRAIEIGRMRRRGRARWVVVSPEADGARLRDPTSLLSAARLAVAAWERGGRRGREEAERLRPR